MKKIKLNIKKFGQDMAFIPADYINLCNATNYKVSQISNLFNDYSDMLSFFSRVAGSPKLSKTLRDAISQINNGISSMTDYFNGINIFFREFADMAERDMGVELSKAISDKKFEQIVLPYINEEFDNGLVGIQQFTDIDSLVQFINDFVNNFRNLLSSFTDEIKNANNSLPNAICSEMSSTIERSNNELYSGINDLSNYLADQSSKFEVEFRAAIDELATLAEAE